MGNRTLILCNLFLSWKIFLFSILLTKYHIHTSFYPWRDMTMQICCLLNFNKNKNKKTKKNSGKMCYNLVLSRDENFQSFCFFFFHSLIFSCIIFLNFWNGAQFLTLYWKVLCWNQLTQRFFFFNITYCFIGSTDGLVFISF